ncbi:aminopeptidase P family protein [Poseidonocella sedimentorum]|uniref:Xaa-Pro aminopeptidase n=1 Tax=Poseidonocella sedimentorum TaxID=871652 RepID=A0A1I6CP88_9RHOB|nr:aminopeptidase P family protein [Poseidonocella sedimentorum]SFQ94985.1 Xaa-Pro aminopeptidase [Poseidonocella sedimentorum]
MFQSFEVTARPEQGPPRLAALRAEMARVGLDGVVVPRADAHQGEYVAPCDARLEWLTGFTGSAGFAAVLADKAGVFVDGRYRVQVRAQVATEVFTPIDWPEVKLADWLLDHAGAGAKIGFDPWLHTCDEIARLTEALGERVTLVATETPVDRVWPDRPAPPGGAAEAYPDALAGRSAAEKRALCAEALAGTGEAVAVLTLPDSICWLLNMRGSDIPRIPIVQSFALLHADQSVDLFIAPEKCAGLSLGPEVRLHPPEAFAERLRGVTGRVRIDPKSAPRAVADLLGEGAAEITFGPDPCVLPKACKTEAEIAATREAHLRDGAAMCRFLHWLDAQTPGGFTEIDAVRALEDARRETGALRDISFDTISGAGPHGAIVHYRVTEETDRTVGPGDLLLVDSGGQYLDGTTDITRTMAIGTPDAEMIAAYTRVLQGMIALSRIRWPKGLAGRDLDALARAPLWMAGMDYDHGTGHGVGVYLSVHEGPQRFSRLSETPLLPGMILSNEPGYYREGAFGIRIENLVVVTEAAPVPGGDPHRAFHGLETLTLAPFDRRLIDAERLSAPERDWVDAYHLTCRERLLPSLGKEAGMWLMTATQPL